MLAENEKPHSPPLGDTIFLSLSLFFLSAFLFRTRHETVSHHRGRPAFRFFFLVLMCKRIASERSHISSESPYCHTKKGQLKNSERINTGIVNGAASVGSPRGIRKWKRT